MTAVPQEDMQPRHPTKGYAICAANLRQEREPGDPRPDYCLNPAGKDTDHFGVGYCKTHLGRTGNHQKYALKVQAEREVSKWGARRDISAPEALLELVQWKATEVQFWQGKVDSLTDDDMTWGTTKEEDGYGGEDGGAFNKTTREAVPHVYIKLLHDAQKALADFCTSAMRAGADASLINLAQSRASLWLGAMRRMMADPRVKVDGNSEDVIYDALKELQSG